jgi:DNA-binding winged helix-turn-helix (wHTH) protein/tetratricopeptide (TPR) repeat protein
MPKQVFAFSEFIFDCDTGTLTRKNRGTRLPEKTARLLEVLLERANTLVSREELRQKLWPGEEFLDYDQGINVAVNRLRNVLRENSRNPQFLKTIPKRGYSFCGDVRLVPLQVPHARAPETTLVLPPPEIVVAPESASQPEIDAPREWNSPAFAVVTETSDSSSLAALGSPQRRRRWTWAVALLGIAALIAVAASLLLRQPKATPHVLRLGIASLRVAGDQQARNVGEGFRLELSDAVSRLPRVQVPAAEAFVTANAVDIPRISRELNLDDLLLGSIAKQGEQYDLKFELVRATDATHLASFEYSGPAKDLPEICEHLQQDIFHYLQSNAVTLQTIKGSTNDAQAYELYLQGEYHMLERDPDSLNRSLSEFRQATARDSNFAAAYAGLATAYLKLSAYDTDPHDGLLSKAESFAQRAVKLDPLLAQAHAVLGCTAYKLDRDFSRGEAELRNAIRIDPTQAAYRDWLSVLLVEEGRFDEALEQLNLAQTNAPFWPSVYAMEGMVALYARRDATAMQAAKRYVDLLPNLPIAHNTMAWVYFETGHYKDAIEEWRQMAMLQNNQARVALENEGMEIFRTKGIRAYAKLRLDAIRSKRGMGQANDFSPAEWYACAGKGDQALAELERLATANDPYMLHVGVDPIFDSLHRDPRFLAMLAKSGLVIPSSLQNANSHLCE